MKNKQGITIAALIIAIVGLSIGFAAFSNTLSISSSANVNPENTMNVVFSSSNSDAETDPIVPTLNPNNVTGFTSTNGTIVESGRTLSNLSAAFTAPGQSVTYNLYVYNDGPYVAYLTDLTMGSISCDAIPQQNESDNATDSLVEAACRGMSVSVTIGTVTLTSSGSLNNQSLQANGGYVNASVTISYAEGSSYVDGPMSVTIGDITFAASSVAGEVATPSEPQEEITKCTYSDLDSSGTITIGDKVSCPLEEQTDSFYVIEDLGQGTTVKMLAEWNLNTTTGLQSESNPTPVAFDSTTTGEYGYWALDYDLNTSVYSACTENCDGNNPNYPAYVYDNNSTLKTFVDIYVDYLKSTLSTNATGRLINISELEALGCSINDFTCSDSPATASAWVYQTSYWSGCAFDYRNIWLVYSGGDFGNDNFDYVDECGVRPVIEISSSVIQTS